MNLSYNITIEVDKEYGGLPPNKTFISSCVIDSLKSHHVLFNGIKVQEGPVEYSNDKYDQLREALSLCTFPLGGKQRQKRILQNLANKINTILEEE